MGSNPSQAPKLVTSNLNPKYLKDNCMIGSKTELQKVAGAWAKDEKWTGIHGGLNFDLPSPTADNETVGLTIRRLGDDLYREASSATAIASQPNLATFRECEDLRRVFPDAMTWFNKAVEAGFEERQQHTDPMTAMLELLTVEPGTRAQHPIGDINPRYAQYVSAGVVDTLGGGSVGGPQIGRVSTSDYSDNDE